MFFGISGDMTLGALVDAGCDVDRLRAELHGLQVPGWELTAEKVWKNGMAATYVKVKTEDQKHRSLSAILEILENSGGTSRPDGTRRAIFTNLDEAEARSTTCRLKRFTSTKSVLWTPSWISSALVSAFMPSALNNLPVPL